MAPKTNPILMKNDLPRRHDKLLLTAPEAAGLSSICERTLWGITTPRGPVPCVRIGTGVRYYLADLRDFCERTRTVAPEHVHGPDATSC